MQYEQMAEADGGVNQAAELLLFFLGSESYGIDITRVKEVIPRPAMTQVPHSHPAVSGVTHLRGTALTVIDLQRAIGNEPAAAEGESVIVTELAGERQGFLVSRVDRIVHCQAADFSGSPSGIGSDNYIKEVAHHADGLIQLLDFDKILSTVLTQLNVTAAVA